MQQDAMTAVQAEPARTADRQSRSDYDEARKLYNGMIDKRPLMIARCADVADVVAAVNFAREHESAGRHPRRRAQRAGPRQRR